MAGVQDFKFGQGYENFHFYLPLSSFLLDIHVSIALTLFTVFLFKRIIEFKNRGAWAKSLLLTIIILTLILTSVISCLKPFKNARQFPFSEIAFCKLNWLQFWLIKSYFYKKSDCLSESLHCETSVV